MTSNILASVFIVTFIVISTAILITRWVLKIADFGLGDLLDEPPVPHLLYQAPELLRCLRVIVEISVIIWYKLLMFHDKMQIIDYVISIIRLGERVSLCGSQKGDVYSFAIILYEIHGRS